jgi:hypothetical protein
VTNWNDRRTTIGAAYELEKTVPAVFDAEDVREALKTANDGYSSRISQSEEMVDGWVNVQDMADMLNELLVEKGER